MKHKNHYYIALHKPKGYVSALQDNLYPTVFSLVEEHIDDLHIVGRLDIDTTGIIILTNDGKYTHNATHPKKHVSKVYEVTPKNPLTETDILLITQGMKIDHGETQLKPAKVELIDEKKFYLTLTEGKFHQVKKMLAALNNEVLELHRVSFDTIDLRSLDIAEGKYLIFDKL